MVTGSPSSYAQTSTNECTTVLVLIRICQDRQQGKDSSSRTENLNHFVLMHWNILQRLAPPVAMKYILLSCHPHGMVWPVVLHVKARVLGCTGTNGVGRRLGLAGAWVIWGLEDYDLEMRWKLAPHCIVRLRWLVRSPFWVPNCKASSFGMGFAVWKTGDFFMSQCRHTLLLLLLVLATQPVHATFSQDSDVAWPLKWKG